MATKDGPKFKKLGDALAAFDNGQLPKGTKLVIGAVSTSITHRTTKTEETFFRFDGTPAAFAKMVLKTNTKIRVVIEGPDETDTAPAIR